MATLSLTAKLKYLFLENNLDQCLTYQEIEQDPSTYYSYGNLENPFP